MEIIIFIIYLLYFLYAFKLYGLDKRIDLSLSLLSLLFLFKVLCGCLNLYFHNSEYLYNDSHTLYHESMVYLNDFHNKPTEYLSYWLFNWGGPLEHINFIDKSNSIYWSDVGKLMHTRFMILCNILSFGHEYVNIIFYNVIYFLGQIAFLKTLLHFQPDKKWLYIIILFFLPGIAFWNSGIHKDGFILAAFGGVSWLTLNVLRKGGWKNILFLAIALFLMFGIRYFYFFCFIPAYLAWVLLYKNKRVSFIIILLYSVGLLLFLFSDRISPSFNLKKIVVHKQEQFFENKGYSDVQTPMLETTNSSFFKNAPTAIEHVFVEPIPQFNKNTKYTVTAIDSLLVLLLFSISFVFVRKKYFKNGYYVFMLLFSLSVLLFIGYTVPNLGAIVRYKSPFMAILLCALISLSELPILQRRSTT